MKRIIKISVAAFIIIFLSFMPFIRTPVALGFIKARVITGAEYAWDLEASRERRPNVIEGKVSFLINRLASGDVADGSDIDAVRRAFNTWAEIPTSRIDFVDLGLTDRTVVGQDGTNLVIWEKEESIGLGVLAVAMVSIRLKSLTEAEITDADFQFNGFNFRWTTEAEPGKVDIEGIATHEIGHLIGLDHSFIRLSTMFPSAPKRAENARSLEIDDMAGASALYPNELFAAITGMITGKVIFGRNSAVGSPGPLEPNDSPSQATPIGFGDTVEAAIGRPGDVDFYAFSALAGEKVIANVEASRAGSPLDPILTLLDEDGRIELASNDNFDGRDPRIVFDLPRSGRFFLKVTSAQEEEEGGDDFFYRLSLNTVFGAHLVAFDAGTGQPVLGAITDKAGKYALAGLPPGDYALKADPISPANLERYYNKAFSDFRSSFLNRASDFAAAQILTLSPSSVISDVDLIVGRADEADPFEADDSPLMATPIGTDGAAQLHHVFPAGDEDYVQFNAIAGETYIIETSELALESDTFLTLFDVDGQTVLSSNDDIDLGVNLASRLTFAPQATGTYFASVRHFLSSAEGARTDYNISVRRTPFSITMEPRQFPGNPFNFTLTIRAPGTIALLRPETFRFVVDGRDLAQLFLRAADLILLSEDEVIFSLEAIVLPQRVIDLEASIEDGNGLRAVDMVSYGQEISPGTQASGDIAGPGGLNEFVFKGSAGDLVDVAVNRVANLPDGSGSLDPILDLIGPNGLTVARNDDGGGDSPPGPGRNALIERFSLPSTGRYTVAVKGYSSTYGPFVVSLGLSRPEP